MLNSKRRRTQLACTTCRHRKIRCDGRRPHCTSCIELSTICEYAEVSEESRSRRSFKSRAHLLHKVRELEGQLQRNHAGLPRGVHNIAINNSTGVPVGATQEPTSAANGVAGESGESEEENAVDMLATSTFEHETTADNGHFGPSSNHALFRAVSHSYSRVVSIDLLSRHSSRSRRHRQPRSSVLETPSHLSCRVTADPSAESVSTSSSEVLLLIDHFFVTVGVVLPVLNKATLLSHYQDLQSSPTLRTLGPERALVNIVLAHGASLPLNSNGHKVYYSRALAALDGHQLRRTSIELVQALLLIATYQQNHQLSITSWTYHALAVKAAYQLGLHSPVFYKDFGVQESELRRRLWYGLIIQDRTLCICLGRPFLIPVQYNCISKPLDLISSQSSSSFVGGRYTNGLVYFNQLISLYDIAGEITRQLHSDNIEREQPPTLRNMIVSHADLRWQLGEWRSKLPSACKLISSSSSDGDSDLGNQSLGCRLILSIHYYRAAIFLNASLLTMALENVVMDSVHDDQFGVIMDTLTPIIAADFADSRNLSHVIDLASKQPGSFLDQNNAWWLCNYTIFAAGLHIFAVLLIAYKHEPIQNNMGVTLTEVRECIQQSLDTMKSIQRTSLMSRKARQCLTSFLEVFDSLTLDQTPSASSVANQPVLDDSISVLPSLAPENDYSLWVMEAANDFLAQYNDNFFFDDNLNFFPTDLI